MPTYIAANMTFDLTPEQAELQTRARELAATVVAPAASQIDQSGEIPGAVLGAVAALRIPQHDATSAMLMIEEVAAASGAVAVAAALGLDGPPAGFAGLRGVRWAPARGDRDHLAMAAVCLGLGRAAVAEATAAARRRGDRPAGDPGAPPHWALADAATAVDAARLLVHAAAMRGGLPAEAVMVYAANAAIHAADAAIRIVGADGYQAGSLLERCERDARAACLVLGTEDSIRQRAADALLA
jgi:alkylation response protein AidB-like acyl-CoA dehydrogenase